MNREAPLTAEPNAAPSAAGAAPATIEESLAEFAATLDDSDIPSEVRARACHHMLDALGIALAATRYDFAHKCLAGVRAVGSEGEVPVFGMPARLAPRDAAIMNGILCHGLDYDDTHIAGVTHPTCSILPAALSAAAMAGASGREMVTAYVVGVEAAARIGSAAHSAFHQVGFHPTGIVGVFGCTLAAGRLLGLNARQLVHAQGIALSMASGSMQFLEDGAWNKRLHPGWAAQAGIVAAALAREGFQGATRPYDGRFGLFNTYGGRFTDWVDLSLATAGLGEVWEMMNVGIKPYPTCHITHAPIDAALALRDRVDLARIREIEVRIPHQAFSIVCEPEANKRRPVSDYDAKFSLHYLVAAALVRGRITLAELEPGNLRDPEILALVDRVRYADYPDSPFPEAYSGAVIIRLDDGTELAQFEPVNRGAADRPLSNAEIVAKFRANAAMLLAPRRIAAVEEALLGLDDAPDARAALAVAGQPA